MKAKTNKKRYLKASKIYKSTKLTKEQLDRREKAINDLRSFIELCASFQVLAHCHEDLCTWLNRDYNQSKLLLWPRDHGKSRFASFYSVWRIIRNPAITIIYASATAEKAEEMMRFMKVILESKEIAKYFPGLIKPQEGQRKLWNNTNIIVDHTARDKKGVVDSTIMTCGINKNITGKHCDLLVLDDIMVRKLNTDRGREEVRDWVADACGSVMSAESEMLVVGTRYHAKDIYQDFLELDLEEEDEEGNISEDSEKMFVVRIANIEEDGDFLWPRTQSKSGTYYGFNNNILQRKKKLYLIKGNLVDFNSQYYNNPHDNDNAPINKSAFRYYKKEDLVRTAHGWEIGNKILSIYAAFDPAYTTHKKSDFSAIVVGGITSDGERYFLYGEEFKTDKPSKMYERLQAIYEKYEYKNLVIEAVSGAYVIAKDMKDRLYKDGIRVPVDFFTPNNRYEDKEARIQNILEPLYKSDSIYHYRGGICEKLEEQLVQYKPPHDDLKDAWYMVNASMKVSFLERMRKKRMINKITTKQKFHPRFGGLN